MVSGREKSLGGRTTQPRTTQPKALECRSKPPCNYLKARPVWSPIGQRALTLANHPLSASLAQQNGCQSQKRLGGQRGERMRLKERIPPTHIDSWMD